VATDLVTGVLRVTLAAIPSPHDAGALGQTGELPAPIMAADAQLRVAFDLLRAGSTTSPSGAATVTCRRPEPDHRHLDAGSSRASARARQLGVSHRCSFMLRLLWAEQNLIRLEVLQVELAVSPPARARSGACPGEGPAFGDPGRQASRSRLFRCSRSSSRPLTRASRPGASG